MEKSNARPPTATFYHTVIPRTKQLKRFAGREGPIFAQETLKQAAEKKRDFPELFSFGEKLNGDWRSV